MPFKRAHTHCHHLCSFPVASQDIVKCKSQLLDNGDGADSLHSSFILRAGGGGGGGGGSGGGAGFAGEITESRWMIQYSHCSECSQSTEEPSGVSIGGEEKSQQVSAASLLSSPARRKMPSRQLSLRSLAPHVSWKTNKLGVKCVLFCRGLTHASLAPERPACRRPVVTQKQDSEVGAKRACRRSTARTGSVSVAALSTRAGSLSQPAALDEKVTTTEHE